MFVFSFNIVLYFFPDVKLFRKFQEIILPGGFGIKRTGAQSLPCISRSFVKFFLFCLFRFITDQPVIHLFILTCGIVPGKICCHSTVNHLIPFTFLIVVDPLCIPYCIEHLMGIVVAEGESCTRSFIFIITVPLYLSDHLFHGRSEEFRNEGSSAGLSRMAQTETA